MKPYFIILITLFFNSVYSQEKLSVNLLQDVKLATIGDAKRGYKAFTVNFLARIKMQGNHQKLGYMIIYPEYEFADLKTKYQRYSANLGYVFNTLFNDFELESSFSYGFINHNGTTNSLGFWFGTNYVINKALKINAGYQIVDRTDINKIRYSGFVGLEIKIK